jgi:hypothetical protein
MATCAASAVSGAPSARLARFPPASFSSPELSLRLVRSLSLALLSLSLSLSLAVSRSLSRSFSRALSQTLSKACSRALSPRNGTCRRHSPQRVRSKGTLQMKEKQWFKIFRCWLAGLLWDSQCLWVGVRLVALPVFD